MDDDNIGESSNIFGSEYLDDEDSVSMLNVTQHDEFNPTPYVFILKDIFKKPLLLAPERLRHAQVTCPNFCTLLDHTVAVLWIFYSKNGHEKLGTSQIDWALKFLEGIKNSHNEYSKDIEMAIEDLSQAYVDAGFGVNMTDVESRAYSDGNTSNDFEGELAERDDLLHTSIVYADLIKSADASLQKDILEKAQACPLEQGRRDHAFASTPKKGQPKALDFNEDEEGQDEDDEDNDPIKAEIAVWRKKKILEIVEQLRKMTDIDEAFNEMSCRTSPEVVEKVRKLLDEI